MNKTKVDRIIEFAKTLDKRKLYNWSIKEVPVSKNIWTKDQQKYLDERFGAIDERFNKLEDRFDQLEAKVEKIFDFLQDMNKSKH